MHFTHRFSFQSRHISRSMPPTPSKFMHPAIPALYLFLILFKVFQSRGLLSLGELYHFSLFPVPVPLLLLFPPVCMLQHMHVYTRHTYTKTMSSVHKLSFPYHISGFTFFLFLNLYYSKIFLGILHLYTKITRSKTISGGLIIRAY